MTTPTYTPGNQQWLGLGKEITPGTPVATPTMFIPVINPAYKPVVTPLVDQALRGGMATDYGQAQGMRHDELTYQTLIYADSVFPHLMAILGNTDTITGTAPTVTHKTSLKNSGQSPTYTGFLYIGGGQVEQIPGMVLGDLKFTFKADTLPTIDATWMGLPSTVIAAPVNTPSALPPMPPFTANIVIGGVSGGNHSDCTIDIKRNPVPIAVLNGTQSPMSISGGPLTVTGTFLGVFQGATDTDLTNLLGNVQPTLAVSINAQGDPTHPLTLQLSNIAYDSADPAGSNNSFMTIASAFKAIANATDALDGFTSPMQAIFVNTTVTPF